MTICNHLDGGEELFIIGKNFLKDAKVIFRNDKWMKIVEPNREYLKSVKTFFKTKLLSSIFQSKINQIDVVETEKNP